MKEFIKAFGNITRVKILACLFEKEKNVSDLIGNCRLSQSAVSQHLKKLKEIGIIDCELFGRERFYKLKNKKAGAIAKEILSLINNKK